MTAEATLAAHVLATHITAAGMLIDRVVPSECVYLAERPARVAYAVRSGQLAEYRVREDGREWIVRLLRAQSVFGLEAVRDGAEYQYTVEALGEAEVVPFSPKMDVPLPLVAGALAEQREAAHLRAEAFVTQDLRARVAAFVLGDAIRAGVARSGGTFTLSVLQKTLAAHEGTTQPHIAEALGELCGFGAIVLTHPRVQTRIRILDVDGLRAEAARESTT